jgi:hypothetical protein
MAQWSLKIGFERLKFREIASWTLPINRASQRVMEKLGFRYERDFEFAGLPHLFYRLSVDDWDAPNVPPDPSESCSKRTIRARSAQSQCHHANASLPRNP